MGRNQYCPRGDKRYNKADTDFGTGVEKETANKEKLDVRAKLLATNYDHKATLMSNRVFRKFAVVESHHI